tara:strand:- start:70 stop:561 length:492 start_codon:yes stop_codon:yes gene_type:complete
MLAESHDLDEEQRMKGVLVLESWVNELGFDEIEDIWSVQPGDLRSRVELAEWLLYAMRRILSEDEELRNMNNDAHRLLVESINEVHRRIRYGCKSDLLGLVALRGVGRSRAREMINLLGIMNVKDVVMMTEKDRYKLADLRGWSNKLVENVVASANHLVKKSN